MFLLAWAAVWVVLCSSYAAGLILLRLISAIPVKGGTTRAVFSSIFALSMLLFCLVFWHLSVCAGYLWGVSRWVFGGDLNAVSDSAASYTTTGSTAAATAAAAASSFFSSQDYQYCSAAVAIRGTGGTLAQQLNGNSHTYGNARANEPGADRNHNAAPGNVLAGTSMHDVANCLHLQRNRRFVIFVFQWALAALLFITLAVTPLLLTWFLLRQVLTRWCGYDYYSHSKSGDSSRNNASNQQGRFFSSSSSSSSSLLSFGRWFGKRKQQQQQHQQSYQIRQRGKQTTALVLTAAVLVVLFLYGGWRLVGAVPMDLPAELSHRHFPGSQYPQQHRGRQPQQPIQQAGGGNNGPVSPAQTQPPPPLTFARRGEKERKGAGESQGQQQGEKERGEASGSLSHHRPPPFPHQPSASVLSSSSSFAAPHPLSSSWSVLSRALQAVAARVAVAGVAVMGLLSGYAALASPYNFISPYVVWRGQDAALMGAREKITRKQRYVLALLASKKAQIAHEHYAALHQDDNGHGTDKETYDGGGRYQHHPNSYSPAFTSAGNNSNNNNNNNNNSNINGTTTNGAFSSASTGGYGYYSHSYSGASGGGGSTATGIGTLPAYPYGGAGVGSNQPSNWQAAAAATTAAASVSSAGEREERGFLATTAGGIHHGSLIDNNSNNTPTAAAGTGARGGRDDAEGQGGSIPTNGGGGGGGGGGWVSRMNPFSAQSVRRRQAGRRAGRAATLRRECEGAAYLSLTLFFEAAAVENTLAEARRGATLVGGVGYALLGAVFAVYALGKAALTVASLALSRVSAAEDPVARTLRLLGGAMTAVGLCQRPSSASFPFSHGGAGGAVPYSASIHHNIGGGVSGGGGGGGGGCAWLDASSHVMVVLALLVNTWMLALSIRGLLLTVFRLTLSFSAFITPDTTCVALAAVMGAYWVGQLVMLRQSLPSAIQLTPFSFPSSSSLYPPVAPAAAAAAAHNSGGGGRAAAVAGATAGSSFNNISNVNYNSVGIGGGDAFISAPYHVLFAVLGPLPVYYYQRLNDWFFLCGLVCTAAAHRFVMSDPLSRSGDG